MPTTRRRPTALVVALVCVLTGLLAPGAPARAEHAAAVVAGPGGAGGLVVLDRERVDRRLLTVTTSTPALPDPTTTLVLLPRGYDRHPRRDYPVLYLLHGAKGTPDEWLTSGGARRLTAREDMILVLPQVDYRDGAGFCTDWADGAHRWESFHVGQLVPFVDRTFRTRDDRSQRAIAGLSMGGLCALEYAARHPDLFGNTFAYSPLADLTHDPAADAIAAGIVSSWEAQLGVPPGSIYGDRATDELGWQAHDPAVLAPNLRHTGVTVYVGDGRPGPLDPPGEVGAGNAEGLLAVGSESLHQRLAELGINHTYDNYGPGTHTWPYWRRDLAWTIPVLADRFRHPEPAPSRFRYRNADQHWSVYGWRLRREAEPTGFARLAVRGCRSVVVRGAGAATLTTAPCLHPGRRYDVVETWNGGRRTSTTRADDHGRVTVELPPHPRVRVTLRRSR